MQPNDLKEVRFDLYCQLCKHKDISEGGEPCFECLENPVNSNSHKPYKFEEA